MTTNDYIRNVKTNNWKPLNKKLWQRNYYEHIIRNEIELNKIRKYIQNNLLNWRKDKKLQNLTKFSNVLIALFHHAY